MITKEKVNTLLQRLRFQEKAQVFTKDFGKGIQLQVNCTAQQFIYPEAHGLTVNERQTCNFSAPENMVVFECVHRLLEKGYQPEHIELEPRWKLGRTGKSGRADILVRDNGGKALLLIECKTAGAEYDKEKKNMETHGGQLFSYFQQERDTRYLCLYASEVSDNAIRYHNAIVKVIDRKEDIEAYKKGDETVKLYQHAANNKELFAVWKETFNRYVHYNGIFEYDVNAYKIELKPLKAKDLKPFTEAAGMFNIFMEILRHNNISDNANAFNRMLSLLLCKIVDEEKGDNEVLDFQVKEGEDTPEAIQDRLQKLYARGMKEHLDEDIVYFEDTAIKDIIAQYPRRTPIEKVEEIFKQIKYYTHNEFALKEVHNRELFEQNARVLHEVIRMLQNYRFRYTKKQQMLGDFFELILNHGVKQSEGQFFTPVPIVRFIILSLGLDRIAKEKIQAGEVAFLPKILDYACGAGHFLTESIDELQAFVETLSKDHSHNADIQKQIARYRQGTHWAKERIFGIEKDYRLARTSQIACFLNGDGDANIIFGDGLEDHDRLQLKEKCDLLIANPPYAIKAFKNYLHVSEKQLSLFNDLSENSSEIETLFLERAAQVLKPGGRAGIILPSSILSNGGGLHQNTRTLLLEAFEIKAIAEMGSGTFGATGTNTVILFLQKRRQPFAADGFKKDRRRIADDLFADTTPALPDYIDNNALLRAYAAHRNIAEEDYTTLTARQPNAALKKSELWQDYRRAFETSKEKKELQKSKAFKALEPTARQTAIDNCLLDYILRAERDKFYHFMLTLNDAHQPQRVVIAKAGEKQTAKTFLGYEFSTRKGDEGIKIRRDAHGHALNAMYDDTDHTNPTKANSYIVQNIHGDPPTAIDDSLRQHLRIARLADMLDFERTEFTKALSLNPRHSLQIQSQWQLVRLGEVVELKAGGTPARSERRYWHGGTIKWLKINDYKDFEKIRDTEEKITEEGLKNSTAKLLNAGTVVVSIFATIGRVGILEEKMATNQAIVGLLINNKNDLKAQYLMNIIKYCVEVLKSQAIGMAQPNINSTKLSNLKIPLPPLEVQQKIVAACDAIDTEAERAADTIAARKSQIEQQVTAIAQQGYPMKRLGEVCEVNPSKTEIREVDNSLPVSFIEMASVSEQGFIQHKVDRPLKELKKGGYTYFKNEDIIVAKITPCMENGKCAIATGLTNKIGFGSSEFHVFRADKNVMYNTFLFSYLNREVVRKEAEQHMTGKSGHRRVPERFYISYQIPVPPLSAQKALVEKIEHLEREIAAAQKVIATAAERKEQVLAGFL